MQYQGAILILNTGLLLLALIVFELVYSSVPKQERKQLSVFYPYITLFIVILLYAAYRQVGKL